MGYGIAAFGVGPLERFAGLDLSTIYGWAAVVALAMGALSFVVVRRAGPAGSLPLAGDRNGREQQVSRNQKVTA